MFEVFVCACDKYKWIFNDFIKLADKNCPYEVKFFSEEFSSHLVCPVGKGPWYERMLRCLDNLNCDDVIYLQEDFLTIWVNERAVEDAYKFHSDKKAYITKLGNNHEFSYSKYPARVDMYQVYLQNPADEYLMSHQPVAIFNKEFLQASLEEIRPEGPSEHELEGSKWMRENCKKRVFCLGLPNRPKNTSNIWRFEHAIRKGEVLPDAKGLLQ